MPKKAISSVELAALINELQFLKKGKINQIYHNNEQFLFQLHAPGKGKQLLKIIPGKWICLTKNKETKINPSGFCMQLRKYLDNAFIKDISQKDSERIMVFELEKKETYFLIIELFSKGNLILTKGDYTIITALEQHTWKDRTVKPGEKYIFPSQGVNWKTMTEKELTIILNKSEKRNLATALATEIGLGGVYAEEICTQSKQDKDLASKEADSIQIFKALKDIRTRLEESQGYIYENDVTPFPLQDAKPVTIVKTYNEAIDTLIPFQITSPYEKKINALQRMIEEQERSIEKLNEKIQKNKKKGELIYEKYQPLQKLLGIVKEMKKTKDWKDIAVELKKEKKIKTVDLKHKKIIISF